MEVVLLWLDDLDDLVFAGAMFADRLRLLALSAGALAAGALGLCTLEILGDAWAIEAAWAAALGVSLWFASGLLGEHGVVPVEDARA